jgi:hypothetical protein
VAYYVCSNFFVLDYFVRIYSLLRLLDDDHFVKAVTRLSLHSWVLNPFSYFGDDLGSRLISAKGSGGLILVWWLCNASLYGLGSEAALSLPGIALQGLFLGVGLATMLGINRVFFIVLERSKTIHDQLYKRLAATRLERSLLTIAGIGVGGAICYFTQLSGLLKA